MAEVNRIYNLFMQELVKALPPSVSVGTREICSLAQKPHPLGQVP